MNELINIEEHIAYKDFKISDAASKLENLKLNPVLFLVNENKEFVGSITDGDIRRALIKGSENRFKYNRNSTRESNFY